MVYFFFVLDSGWNLCKDGDRSKSVSSIRDILSCSPKHKKILVYQLDAWENTEQVKSNHPRSDTIYIVGSFGAEFDIISPIASMKLYAVLGTAP